MDLDKCTASRETNNELRKEHVEGCVKTTSQQTSFFPLVLDDYFMSVAILSGTFSEVDEVSI